MRSDEVTINGVGIRNGAEAGGKEVRTLSLASGKIATIRKGFGRDLMRAQRVAGPNGDPTAVVFALIAELAEIDGSRIVYEDVLAMELSDVLTLQAEVAGANFQDPPPAPSRHSSTSDSQ